MTIAFWHWWALGLGLLLLEVLISTEYVLIWIGASAVIVGLLAWTVPGLPWQAELVAWGLLSAVTFFLWRRFRPAPVPSDRPTLNRRGESYVARTFTLAEPIVNGIGQLRVDDSQWRISGPDLPAGSRVRVTRADGSTLHVEPA